jgi:molybdopterin synthase sulfur carrier subunit
VSVRVLFFGAIADAVGERSQRVEISEATPAGAVVDQIVASHPELSRHRLLLAVNEEYVARDARLEDGDQIAIFTAVSGG